MPGRQMEREIREQPGRLEEASPRFAERLSDLYRGRSYDMALLAARGSSDNAALYARYLIEIHLGIPAVLAAPSVLTRYGVRVRYPRCLAIGISQSGAAPGVSEVIGALREAGHDTLAITNDPDSRLAQAAQATLALNVGAERAVAATKTYSASLLALYELARALGGELPASTRNLPGADWADRTREAAEAATSAVNSSQIVFALARGYRFCSAQEAALKLMECALLACKSYSVADFQHGPRALAGDRSAAIVFGEEVPGLREQGCRVITCPEPNPPLTDALAPLWDAFFAQWLALLCSRARGLDADDPRFLQKVTETL